MASNSSNPDSIFQDGKIRPGIYKIQNIVSGTYVGIKDHVRELCGRPSSTLYDERGHWEISPLGKGYTISKVKPSTAVTPEQYCTLLDGIGNGYAVSVSDIPVAWKIHAVDNEKYRGFEYVCIHWSSTNKVWDLAQWGADRDGTKVQLMENTKPEPCRMWRLVPIRVRTRAREPSSSSLTTESDITAPTCEDSAGSHRCSCSHLTTELGDDDSGTTVVEVTTVTTRRKYRLED